MTYASAEKRFYQQHYQGGLQPATDAELAAAAASYFAPGKRYRLLLDELEPGREYGTAVEIGCSKGECLAYLGSQRRFKALIGIDIAFADGMSRQVGNVRFMQANSNDGLPLDDGSVDVVVAMMVIEHLFCPFHAFREVARVLSPQGQGFINLPLVTSVKNRLRLLVGRLPVTSVPFERWLAEREWDCNHLHYFSMDAIHRLCALSGLRVTRVAGVGRLHGLKTRWPSLLADEVSFVVQRGQGGGA